MRQVDKYKTYPEAVDAWQKDPKASTRFDWWLFEQADESGVTAAGLIKDRLPTTIRQVQVCAGDTVRLGHWNPVQRSWFDQNGDLIRNVYGWYPCIPADCAPPPDWNAIADKG